MNTKTVNTKACLHTLSTGQKILGGKRLGLLVGSPQYTLNKLLVTHYTSSLLFPPPPPSSITGKGRWGEREGSEGGRE